MPRAGRDEGGPGPRLARTLCEVDASKLARRLIGCRLVRVREGRRLSGMIVETEAYLGVEDAAAHSFGGRRTARTEAMFARAGTAYVYFTYGMHHCMNVVCGREGEPVAVLLRALEPSEGLEEMRGRRAGRARGGAPRDVDLCSGPAKLCQAMGIDRALTMTDLIDGDALFLEAPAPGVVVRPSDLVETTRIGVDRAGEWSKRPLRWYLRGNPHVSVVAPA